MRKLSLFILLSIFFAIGCDKDFEEINDNPNEPSSVPSGLLTADIVRVLGNSMYSTFVGGDMGSCWGQHWSKVQYNDEERYVPRGTVITDLVWKNIYESVISDARSMQKIATEEGNKNMQGVALVLQAYGYALLTDVFGDIPFSEAMKADEGIFSPKYDKQEDVYTGVLQMLDEANTLLTADGGTITATSDLVYGGDYMKWKKFANSLKFRCLMRISGKKDVATQLQELVNTREMFASNSDEAKLAYLSADPNANPIFETIVFGTRNEFKVNEVLVNMLTSLNDPRLPIYVAPNEAGQYRGKPAGIENVPNDDYNYTNVSAVGDYYLRAQAPAYFLSYSELQFLMAEAAQRGLISGSAADYYNGGIRASFEANGLTSGDADAYLSQAVVAYSAGNGLKQIAEQNWLGLYCQGIETWTEWRRTQYPVLQPAIEAVLNEIPSRYTYPGIEQSVNAANYDAAVANQGPNLLTTKVWWMN